MIKIFSYLQDKHGISRREYMQMLKEQAVHVNNELVESMQATIKPGDTLKITSWKNTLLTEEIQDLRKKKRMIVLFNKPKWYAVSKEDKHNKTIYSLLPQSWQKDFYYIGRLDKDSHGLLLLTNDPTLVDYYEKPENNVHKIYEVQIDRPLKTYDIEKAKKWVLVDENWVRIIQWKSQPSETAEILKVVNMRYQMVKNKHYVAVTLNEWKKRHIRRLLKWLGYIVKDLKRIKVGKYQLWTIKPWKYMMQPYK